MKIEIKNKHFTLLIEGLGMILLVVSGLLFTLEMFLRGCYYLVHDLCWVFAKLWGG